MTQLGNDVQRALSRADMQPLIESIDGVRDILTDPATLDAIKTFGTVFAQSINLALIPMREVGRLMEVYRSQRDTAAPLEQIIGSEDPVRMQRRIVELRRRIDAALAPDAPRGCGDRRRSWTPCAGRSCSWSVHARRQCAARAQGQT